jgi:hypothetical protein
MTKFKLTTVFLVSLAMFTAGCSVIGYELDKHIGATQPAPSGGGRPNIPPDQARSNVFTTVGDHVDKEILKVLTTRREQNDVSWRDVQDCDDDEIKVCSVSAGCNCRPKR